MKITITVEMEDYELEKEQNEQKDKQKEKSMDYSQYARFFDDGCPGWTKDPEYNLVFLKVQQQYANDVLRSKGYLFLNDVYDQLGIPKTKAGKIVGWIYDEENPIGDNFVDFSLFGSCNSDFINGYESKLLLDFNVDGVIANRIKMEES